MPRMPMYNPAHSTLLDVLTDLAYATPSAPFLTISPTESLSYSSSHQLATRLIPNRLLELCPNLLPSTPAVERNSTLNPPSPRPARVAIISNNSPLYALTLFSLWSRGITAVPLSLSTTDPSLWLHMIEVAQVDVLLLSEIALNRLLSVIEESGKSPVPVVMLASLVPGLSIKGNGKRDDFDDAHVNVKDDEGDGELRKIYRLCQSWVDQDLISPQLETPHPHSGSPQIRISSSHPAVILFTSSAINKETLKCVIYTHSTLIESGWRTVLSFSSAGGGAENGIRINGGNENVYGEVPEYATEPKRHLGWLPLSHAFELTISLLGIVLRTGGSYIFHSPSTSSPSLPPTTPLPHLLLASLSYYHSHNQTIQSFCTVPGVLLDLYNELLPEELVVLRELKILCAAGAASPPEIKRWARTERITYIDLVGATEVAGGMCTSKVGIDGTGDQVEGLTMMPNLMGVLEKQEEGDDFGELIVTGRYIPSKYEYGTSNAYSCDPQTRITAYRTGDLYSCGPSFTGQCILVGQPLPVFNSQPALSDIHYLGRLDDMVIFSSGLKIDALALERVLDAQPEITRSAVVGNGSRDAILAFIEPAFTAENNPNKNASHTQIVDAVLRLNRTLPFEKRIQRENIIIVDNVPVTSKLTVHRKKVKEIVRMRGRTSEASGDGATRSSVNGRASGEWSGRERFDGGALERERARVGQKEKENVAPLPKDDTKGSRSHMRKHSRMASLTYTTDATRNTPPPRSPGGIGSRSLIQSRSRMGSVSYSDTNTITPSTSTFRADHSASSSIAAPSHDHELRYIVESIIADIFSMPVEDIRIRSFLLTDLPMTSLASVQLTNAIKTRFHCDFTRAKFYSLRTVSDLCELITQTGSNNRAFPDDRSTKIEKVSSSLSSSVPVRTDSDNDLVISGACCRFPLGINSLDDFWSVLISPDSYSSTVGQKAPPSRWDAEASHTELPMGWLSDASLDNIPHFSSFFKIPPTEVETMTPNTRLVMQIGYEAIEDAGIAPKSLNGKEWGVFTSMNDSGWQERRRADLGLEEYSKTWGGGADDSAGGRLAYFLNLTGPSIEVKTACSSSAVALHQACSAIRSGDCEAAIVICSTTHFSPTAALFRLHAGIGSKSGRCATFGQDADGFLPSEAAVAVIIQKRSDVSSVPYARIRGSAVGQDGRSQGFSSPNGIAQAKVIEKALTKAGCEVDDISYFEAHGTGTPVGDVIEIDAINRVYGARRTKPLLLGAVKAVVGHTEECAGLTGILKAMLCFQHNVIPPQPNLKIINEELDLFASKIVIPRSVEAFIEVSRPRLAAISSFGLSGTLAHIILEDIKPENNILEDDKGPHLFVLSAHSPQHFTMLLKSFISYSYSVRAQRTSLMNVCRTLRSGRDHFPYRRAWTVKGWKELVGHFQTAMRSPPPPRAKGNPSLALCFSLPHISMALPVIDIPVYHRTLAECARHIYTQELEFFAKQLALARALEALGCRISAVCGEGPGEYMAAVFTGAMQLSTAFELLRSLESGNDRSWIVDCPRDVLEENLLAYGPDEIRIRGSHTLQTTCISGTVEAVSRLQKDVGTDAFRDASWLVDCRLARPTPFQASSSRIPLFSSHLADVVDFNPADSLKYWLGVPERSFDLHATQHALADCSDMLVDMCSMSPLSENDEGVLKFQDGVQGVTGRLYELGCAIDWNISDPSKAGMVHMPTYPWTE